LAKLKTIYVCQECGTTSPKWMGKCNNCNAWNTYVEEIVESAPKNVVHKKNNTAPQLIETIQAEARPRIQLADQELNRVLGGGIVQGSLVLIGGEPGIGKSTLLLQDVLQTKNLKTLYVSGEESESQIKMRAERIASINKDIYIYTETDAESIIQQMQQIQPDIVVIDSIQTIQTALLDSAPGSVAQIRESTYLLQQYAKKHHVPIFIVGHITKDGVIAGPKLLEHIVDCVLQFEGDRNYNYRIIRTIKNRFGSTAELGIYEMQSSGLRAVSNPSELLITEREDEVSGVAIAITMEGNRAMLIEVQALVSSAVYGTPQRSSTGYDLRRLNMILAVLDKRCGFRFGSKDVFLNIAGGLKIDDPSADMAVVAALLSSYDDIALSNEICFSGEVGLSGEIRAVNKIDIRIAEAAKLGYKNIYISKYNHKIEPNTSKIRLSKTVLDFYKSLF
jgi:DNA repair protein RadA/Sms